MTDIRKIAQEVKSLVERRMYYKTDDKVYDQDEYWVSHADYMMENIDDTRLRIAGDCDDYSLTQAEIFVKYYNIDPALVRIVHCEIPHVGHHLVSAIDDPEDNDRTWILCLNLDRVYDWRDIRYIWHKGMRLSEKGVWREIPA